MSESAQSAYRMSAVPVSGSIGLVVALYEQLTQDLSRAVTAFANQDIEQRSHNIGHALLVLGCLQGHLDFERGGEVARKLNDFYNLVRRRLLDAQCTQSADILREQISLLLSVREAWIEAGQQSGSRSTDPRANATPVLERSSDWSA